MIETGYMNVSAHMEINMHMRLSKRNNFNFYTFLDIFRGRYWLYANRAFNFSQITHNASDNPINEGIYVHITSLTWISVRSYISPSILFEMILTVFG